MGTEAWQKERRRTGSHFCQSAEGGQESPETACWQQWMTGLAGEREPSGGGGASTEVDLVVVVVMSQQHTEYVSGQNDWEMLPKSSQMDRR